MKYDDASWHYGGDFPSDLPDRAGGTHIAMFVSWCVLNGLAGEIHADDSPELLGQLKSREVTPCEWFFAACDEKFTDEDLSNEGNAFAQHYYASEEGLYTYDFTKASDGYETIYHVPDSWEIFDALAPVIQRNFSEWQSQR